MSAFFLDIVSEEIPVSVQDVAKNALNDYLKGSLRRIGLDYEGVSGQIFATPRRLAALVKNLPTKLERKKGPWADADEKTIKGFLEANGVQHKDDKRVKLIAENGRKRLTLPPPEVSAMLKKIVEAIPQSLTWPEGMKYQHMKSGQQIAYWVRPILDICAVLDKKPLEGFSAETYANPYHYKNPKIKIVDAAEALEILEEAGVILPIEERVEELRHQLKNKAPRNIRKQDMFALVRRTEKPVLLEAKFGDRYRRELPRELIEEVINEQGCLMPDETTPRFFISTDCVAKNGEKIKKGFKNVIEAKFEDALYFIEQDRKKPLEHFLPQLEDVSYHRNLGSIGLRTKRLENLAEFAAEKLAPSNKKAHDLAARAGLLAKADLVTATVQEFPRLWGVMGEYFLEKQQTGDREDRRDNKIVGQAIKKPRKPMSDKTKDFTENDTAKIVSLALPIADRADYLSGLTLCGEKPTGSSDPFGMGYYLIDLFYAFEIKRAGIGVDGAIIATLAHALELNFKDWKPDGKKPDQLAAAEAIKNEMVDNIRKMGFDYMVGNNEVGVLHARAATTSRGLGFSILCARALAQFAKTEADNLQALVADASRVENIVRPVISKNLKFNERTVTEQQEGELYETYKQLDEKIAARAEKWQVDNNCLQIFNNFTTPLAKFFEKVTVNHEDPKLRSNRLALLLKIRACYRRIADFPKLRTG